MTRRQRCLTNNKREFNFKTTKQRRKYLKAEKQFTPLTYPSTHLLKRWWLKLKAYTLNFLFLFIYKQMQILEMTKKKSASVWSWWSSCIWSKRTIKLFGGICRQYVIGTSTKLFPRAHLEHNKHNTIKVTTIFPQGV